MLHKNDKPDLKLLLQRILEDKLMSPKCDPYYHALAN